ncbi:MAG: heavy metal translocating P-type ATPase, partial [Rhodospirillales bacterium]|nr:heavy metal translocating P-type ATPase [Rhodospirillales bacterium]
MDCPSCASTIETALRRLGGADGVRLDFQSQTLALRLDEAATPRAAIEARVRSLGFEIHAFAPALVSAVTGVADSAADAEPAWWTTGKARLLLALGSLILGGLVAASTVPAVGRWAELPAAVLGLGFFGTKAIRLAGAGTPFSIEMLMSVATLGAVLIGAPAEAAVVVLLFTAGEVLEGVAAGRARAGIRALSALNPRTALLVEDGAPREVPASALQVGQVVLVRPGDRVPTDGTVLEGCTEADESPVTGESFPVPKAEGDTLVAGSINGTGAVQMRVTRTVADNTVARMLHLVEEAQASRAPTARF